MTPALSIVIPAYNEAARLGASLRALHEFLSIRYPDTEIVVVDDGSHDETAEIATRCDGPGGRIRRRVIRYHPNRGKGYAVRRGLLAARSPIVLFTDADLSTPIAELPKLLDPILRGEADLTFGSRALDRTLIGVRQPWLRETGGRVFNLALRLATRLPFWDTQCGFKAFRMSVCRPIVEAGLIDRFGFDIELLYVAHLSGLRLREIPVRWDHREGSKVSLMRDGPRMLRDIHSVRTRASLGWYDDAIHLSSLAGHREQEARRLHEATAKSVA
jgi:dolichyl-phosphate beta-glucosyltransferase